MTSTEIMPPPTTRTLRGLGGEDRVLMVIKKCAQDKSALPEEQIFSRLKVMDSDGAGQHTAPIRSHCDD
jgi:hypothetical protein